MAELARPDRTPQWWLWLFAVYVLVSAVFVYYGKVSRDEGWYLYAGWAIRHGQLLYRDFPYFQAPLMPYLHGLIASLSNHPLEFGRVLSWLAGAMAVFLAARLAKNLAGNLAAGLVCVCFISSSYAVYHLTYVANLAVSTGLAVLAMYCVLWGPGRLSCSIAAIVAAALAVAARLSFLPYWVVVFLLAIWANRHRPLWCGILTAVGTGAVTVWFLPFFLYAPSEALFNMVVAQIIRRGQYGVMSLPEAGPPFWQWVFLSLAVFAFALGLWAMALLVSVRRPGGENRPIALLSVAAVAVYAPNLLPGDVYPNYLTPALPFLACAGASAVSLWLRRTGALGRLGAVAWLGVILPLAMASSVAMLPRLASFGAPQRVVVAETAEHISRLAPTSEPLFTFETILAVAARRPVMSGMEMSYFSFFPAWPTAVCRRLHLLNDELVMEGLARQAFGAVALTDFDLSLLTHRTGRSQGQASPDQFSELLERYHLVRTVSHFGLFEDNLYVFEPES